MKPLCFLLLPLPSLVISNLLVGQWGVWITGDWPLLLPHSQSLWRIWTRLARAVFRPCWKTLGWEMCSLPSVTGKHMVSTFMSCREVEWACVRGNALLSFLDQHVPKVWSPRTLQVPEPQAKTSFTPPVGFSSQLEFLSFVSKRPLPDLKLLRVHSPDTSLPGSCAGK